jgi:hypothetical protein
MACGTGGAVMVFAYWFGVGSPSVLLFVTAQQPVTAKTAVNRHVVMIVTFFFIMVNSFNISFLMRHEQRTDPCRFAAAKVRNYSLLWGGFYGGRAES